MVRHRAVTPRPLTALACSDRVIALGEADVIGLPRLINLAREVQARPDLFAPETDVQYWLNRSRREAAGFNPEAKMRDNWARYLSIPLAGVIPYERKVMDVCAVTVKRCWRSHPATRSCSPWKRCLKVCTRYAPAHSVNLSARHQAGCIASSPARSVRPER